MPAILTVLFVYFIIAKKNNWINSIIVLSIFYSFFYAFAIFRLLYKEVWNRKSDIKSVQSQNQIIRNWSLFLFLSMSIVIVVRLLVWIFFSPLTHQFFYIDNFTWFSAFLWLIIYSIVLIKPEILYGYQYLQKIVDYASVKSSFFMDIWHLDQPNTATISQKELLLNEKISTLVPAFIHNMENISMNSDFFRNSECNFNDLAGELKMPVSHLSYMMKYHCNESFINYKKIIRIQDAANLINQGYLKTSTVQSLAITVGFVAYSTFAKAFKEITNTTANEYVENPVILEN